MNNNFESLECWKACNELKTFIRLNVLSKLPASEKYQLHSQILRASRSCTANIAEGWGRYHYKENIKFLLFARGSIAEVLDHSLEALNWNYINSNTVEEIRKLIEKSTKLVNGYIRYLRNKENTN